MEMMEVLSKNLGYRVKTGLISGQMKLFMPMAVENIDGDVLEPQGKISDEILKALQKFLLDYQEKLAQPRGFMNQYPSRDSIHAKVEKYVFDAEKRDDDLFIVAVLDLNDQLTVDELQRMKQVIGGQVAGNLNGEFEGEIVQVMDEKVEISVWNSSNWYLKTENELKVENGGVNP